MDSEGGCGGNVDGGGGGGRCRLLWKCTMVVLFFVVDIRANLVDHGGW